MSNSKDESSVLYLEKEKPSRTADFQAQTDNRMLLGSAASSVISSQKVASQRTPSGGNPTRKHRKGEKMDKSSISVLKEEEDQQPVLKIQSPFKEVEVMMLVEEYLRLYNIFQRLKDLARINLDLLFTFADVPGAEEELDKVQEIVQVLLNKEVSNLELVDSDQKQGVADEQNVGFDDEQNVGVADEQNVGFDDEQNVDHNQQCLVDAGDNTVTAEASAEHDSTWELVEIPEATNVSNRESVEIPEDKKETICYSMQTQTKKFKTKSKPKKKTRIKQQGNTKNPAACGECGVVLSNEKERKKHVKQFHRVKISQNEPCLCSVCGKAMKNKACLNYHLKIHREKSKNEMHKCKVCGKEFNVKRYLQIHMACHKSEKSFICHVCGKAFRLKNTLTAHFRGLHSNANLEMCKICGKSFSFGNLKRHLILHQGIKPYKCSFCERTFRNVSNRTTHEYLHTENYPHRCSVCGKGFVTPSMLRMHEKRHTGEELSGNFGQSVIIKKKKRTFMFNYECGLCKAKYSHRPSMALHLLRHGDELTQCYLCNDETFSDSAALKHHVQSVHLKEKPCKCNKCDEAFHTPNQLKKHKETNHRDTLWVSFRQKNQSSDNISTKFQCEICMREFNKRANFDRHKIVHSNMKPYQCQVCGFQCKSNGTLKQHGWTHSSNKKHNCQSCDKGFNDKRAYMNHMKRFHHQNQNEIF